MFFQTPSTTSTPIPPLTTNPTNPESILLHHDSRARIGSERTSDNLLPDPSVIKSNQDFNREFFGTQEGVNRFKKQFGPTGLQKARAMYPNANRGKMMLF